MKELYFYLHRRDIKEFIDSKYVHRHILFYFLYFIFIININMKGNCT